MSPNDGSIKYTAITMNNDVLTEIFLHLPVQSLFRFRAVCKFCADVINSSCFRKLHIHSNRSDDTVCLEVIYSNGGIQVQHNTKSLISYNSEDLGLALSLCDEDVRVSLYGPVKGLISIDLTKWSYLDMKLRAPPILICNPFLGQLKLLPLITTSSCRIALRSVAVSFIDEDYKVVQLSVCTMHGRLHAHMYSQSMDSWRELAFDDDLVYVCSIKSMCENGHFAHWKVERMWEEEILSLDMKNELFKKIMLPKNKYQGRYISQIFAKDEHLFWRFEFSRKPVDKEVAIYESRCEGSKLSLDVYEACGTSLQ
ncbi:uncharacterized protein LOC125209413 [Salvia hispanica]|uniref:uncharacterized protein LOC125209413 n=1 Tax=Salvia hispanica TaxID=49212 RepID=UPI0020097932|nr:uncharacterized protein LOC125209413 [Salvia hispanica]